MTLRKLVWMTQSRQQDEWSRTAGLIASVNNLFAKREDRVSLAKFLPEHLKQQQHTKAREEDPVEVAANWAMLRAAFQSGKIRGGG